jgi:hypothetical protein
MILCVFRCLFALLGGTDGLNWLSVLLLLFWLTDGAKVAGEYCAKKWGMPVLLSLLVLRLFVTGEYAFSMLPTGVSFWLMVLVLSLRGW